MSVATEFPPLVHIPDRARRAGDRRVRSSRHLQVVPADGASVSAVHDVQTAEARPALRPLVCADVPAARSNPVHAPLRLTRRGIAVLTLATMLGAAMLLTIAHLSVAGASSPRPAEPAVITVQPGDTLWSIALAVAPHRDPRAVVDQLVSRNHLRGVSLSPGERLSIN